MRIFRYASLAVILILLLGATFLHFAEFKVDRLKPRISAAFSDMDPALRVETQEVFVAVQIFSGLIKARLNQAQLHHPDLGSQGLSVEQVEVDLPLWAPISQNFRPRALKISGAKAQINIPDVLASQLTDALPRPGEQATAADYWGFVFNGAFVPELNQILPDTLPRQTRLEDVELEIRDPTGQRVFLTAYIETGDQQWAVSDKGRQPKVRLTGLVQAPQGRQTPFEVSAELNSDQHADLALRVGEAVPAQFYELLRFLQFGTPERLTTPYRLNAAAQFAPGGSQTLELDIQIVKDDGQTQP